MVVARSWSASGSHRLVVSGRLPTVGYCLHWQPPSQAPHHPANGLDSMLAALGGKLRGSSMQPLMASRPYKPDI